MPQERTRPVQKTVQIIDLVSEEELPTSEEEFFSDVDGGDEKITDAKNANAKSETKKKTARDKAKTARDKAETAHSDKAKPATTQDEAEAAKPEENEHGLGDKRKREDTPATLQDGAKSTCL